MFLKSLEMQGFKSFPDKTVLNFEKGITSVVGPNGSGKSNISDAVRWVLGEKSSRNLRGSKMEDVIFSGTQGRRAQGFAQVTLTLDNTDHSIPGHEEKEISVTRRYYRSGNSEYLINGESVRLRDIEELFMDTGLGSDGYSMVGQGRIEDIISSRSSDRRDMFDEASGIAHFRSRRTDAQRRLSQAEENLVRLRDILGELESRIGPLKVQSEKAQRYLILAQERKDLEIGLLLRSAESANEELARSEEKLNIAAAQHRQADDELAGIEKRIEDSIALTQSMNGQIDEIRRSGSHIDEEIARIEGLIAVDRNSIEHNEGAIERVLRDKASADTTREEMQGQIEEHRRQIETLTADLEQERARLEELSGSLTGARTEDEGIGGQMESLGAELSELTLQIADARISLAGDETSQAELQARLEEIGRTLSGQDEMRALLEGRLAQAKERLSESEEELESVSNSLSGYVLMADKRRKKLEDAQRTRDDLSIKLRQAQSRARMLDDMQKNMEGYSGSVKAVMKQAHAGALTGIHGAVTQIIHTQDQYSTAIETALGAAVQNIVTDTEADAKRAIYYLKEHSLGRATFLPLTSVRGRSLNEAGLTACRGFIDIAANLVTYDGRYEPVIQSLLGRTAVAQDMDCAIAIAKKYSYRFKIVTLDGQVLNAGGSMTGGSRVHSSGVIGRANELEKLAAQIKKMEEELRAGEEQFRTAKEDEARCRAEYEAAKAAVQRVSEEKIRRESDVRLIETQLATARESAGTLGAERETLSSRLAELDRERGEISARIESLTAQSREKNERMELLTAGREELHARREKLNEEISGINLKMLELNKDIQQNTASIDELTRRLEQHSDRLTQYDDEIAQTREKNVALNENIEKLQRQIEDLRLRGSDTKAQIEALIAQREQEEQNGAQLRLLERAKSTEREKLSGELARLEEKKASVRKEYDAAVARLFDEYQLTRREAQEQAKPIENIREAQARLSELKKAISALGSVNVGAVEEYKEVSERYAFMSGQIRDVESSRDEINRLIEDLTARMGEQFLAQFHKINRNFGETFARLFGGGAAKLVLDDPNDPLECGIDIEIQPPGKSVKNIDLFSGGEKGLAGIALLLAILHVKPAPFCIFDEVEAALDDVNVARYAAYLRGMTEHTQFILITHRRGTMEEADTLYGVTMQEKGVSKLLKLNTAEVAAKLGIKE